ncbi:sialate O-acetylesterase [Companilactobacillus muriivasis]|uniref:sialate O-acetylesterase n=1 Tax=Companilactobacillus muriivasis TaxID=3081444 RepID=UPI0030C6ADC3
MATEVLELDPLYSNNMVIPANKAFKISGTAVRNTEVYAEIDNQVLRTTSDTDGNWLIKVAPIESNIETTLKVQNLDEEIVVNNIKTGQVILLTGQSNIEYEFQNDCEYQDQLKDINFKDAYYYNVPKLEYRDEKQTLPDDLPIPAWKLVKDTTVGRLSAVGYWMLKRLKQIYPDQVIGIVDCYKGGTSASSWVPESVLQSDKELVDTFIKPFHEAIDGKTAADFKEEFAVYNAAVEDHNTKLSAFTKKYPEVSLSDAKDKVGHTPWPPPMTPTSFLRPNGLYHTMIEKVKNYPFNEVVWYQGENDAPNPGVYKKLLRGLIISWRQLFENTSLPFYIVQLPGYFDEPKDAWPMIRQSQLDVSQTINDVHLVSISDTGDMHNIHPESKRIAGTRLGEIISGIQYSDTPTVYKQEIADNGLLLFVKNASMLSARGNAYVSIRNNQGWIEQEVYTQGNTVMIPNAEHAIEIRYEYKNFPKCTIFNEYGAPLSPFEMKVGRG